MLPQARTSAAVRFAAALVAVMLTGAPRVAALHAPAEGHRCSCPAHGDHHECECALCRKAALTAQASDESLPPCHRAAAQKALASAKAGSGTRAAPCIEGTCGTGGRPPATVAGVEPFCVTGGATLALPVPAQPVELAAGPPVERAVAPEPPPPRAA